MNSLSRLGSVIWFGSVVAIDNLLHSQALQKTPEDTEDRMRLLRPDPRKGKLRTTHARGKEAFGKRQDEDNRYVLRTQAKGGF
jgi:hypothetical protein